MQLRLDVRPIGEVAVAQCQGRLIGGNEVFTLHKQVGDAIEKYGEVVLQLENIEFVDSSGIGAMMRLVQAARAKGGDLKLCGLTPKIRKVLELTHLLGQFEVYDSIEEAITAAYLGSRYSRGKSGDARPRVVCVYASLDVCAFLREVLCGAGFNALTTTAADDAPILLRATKAKLVVISSRVQIVRNRPVRQALQEIVPDVQILTLGEEFATEDPGDAAEKLLKDVSGILTPVN